jgi:hypothetical protein
MRPSTALPTTSTPAPNGYWVWHLLAPRSQTRHTQHHNFGYTNTLTAEKLRMCTSWRLSSDGAPCVLQAGLDAPCGFRNSRVRAPPFVARPSLTPPPPLLPPSPHPPPHPTTHRHHMQTMQYPPHRTAVTATATTATAVTTTKLTTTKIDRREKPTSSSPRSQPLHGKTS